MKTTFLPLHELSQRVNFLAIPSRYNGSRECNDVTCHAHVEGMERTRENATLENAMRGLESTPCWIAANRASKYDDGCCTRCMTPSWWREKSNKSKMYQLGTRHTCRYDFQILSHRTQEECIMNNVNMTLRYFPMIELTVIFFYWLNMYVCVISIYHDLLGLAFTTISIYQYIICDNAQPINEKCTTMTCEGWLLGINVWPRMIDVINFFRDTVNAPQCIHHWDLDSAPCSSH